MGDATSNSYLGKIEVWLKEIEVKLSGFISVIKIKELRNDPYSGVVVVAPPYYYDGNISNGQKRIQMELKSDFDEWVEYFILLTKNLPIDLNKEIEKSIKYIQEQIELKSNWSIENTADKNVKQINAEFNSIYEKIMLFKGEEATALIPDTNSLIKATDFECYKKLAGNNISIILTPTVLSELDKLKIVHRDEKFRKKVESVINRIKGYRKQGSLLKGVTVYKTITVKTISSEPSFRHTLSWLDKSNNDDRIIASILEYQVDYPSHKVFLVTSDINLQNKAEMAKLPFFETPNV